VATVLANLARLHTARRDFELAKPLFARALAIQDATFGPDYPAAAQSLEGLAFILRRRRPGRSFRPTSWRGRRQWLA
jgi:hypothetical protein